MRETPITRERWGDKKRSEGTKGRRGELSE